MTKYEITDEDRKKLDNSFTYHAPKGDQVDRYFEMREKARSLAYTIMINTPPSPERTLAIRHLENAVMWANKAVAVNES